MEDKCIIITINNNYYYYLLLVLSSFFYKVLPNKTSCEVCKRDRDFLFVFITE